MPTGGEGRDRHAIYLEFVACGGQIKATAIDSVTGIEATIFGPAAAPRAVLEKNAVAKLEYLLKKKANGG